jgi:hypothetical protein
MEVSTPTDGRLLEVKNGGGDTLREYFGGQDAGETAL